MHVALHSVSRNLENTTQLLKLRLRYQQQDKNTSVAESVIRSQTDIIKISFQKGIIRNTEKSAASIGKQLNNEVTKQSDNAT